MQTGWCLPEGTESELVLCGFKTSHLPQLSHVYLVLDNPAVPAVACSHTAYMCSTVVAGSVWMLPCPSQAVCHPATQSHWCSGHYP